MLVEQFVELFCDTQTYTWRGNFYLQKNGLPIGPRATSGIARIVMNHFDRKLLARLRVLRLETRLLVRYIDDVRSVMERIVPGTVIRGDRLEICQDQLAIDLKLEDPEVEVTARVLRGAMN